MGSAAETGSLGLCGDAPDLVAGILREPHRPVGAGRDHHGGAGRRRDCIFRNGALDSDARHLAADMFGEPKGAVGTTVIAPGSLLGVGTGYSVRRPAVVILAILSPPYSVNHSARSGPVTITLGSLSGVGGRYWLVTLPSSFIRSTLLLDHSVNQTAPSGPTPRSQGASGTGYSVIVPMGVILPMRRLPPCSVNHSSLPGPLIISQGWLPGVGSANSVNSPKIVILPIRFAPFSVNQSAPSGPATIQTGVLSGVGIGYSVIAPSVVMRPILLCVDLRKPKRAIRPRRYRKGKTGFGRNDIFGNGLRLHHRGQARVARRTAQVYTGIKASDRQVNTTTDAPIPARLLAVRTRNKVLLRDPEPPGGLIR